MIELKCDVCGKLSQDSNLCFECEYDLECERIANELLNREDKVKEK